jgi:hypothetical protein
MTKSNHEPDLFVMHDGMPLQVQSSRSQYDQHTYFAAYNPLVDYMAWYGIRTFDGRQMTIHIYDIEGVRAWRRSEFDSWFETECHHPVFAQSDFGGLWTLTFVDLKDQEAFSTWWYEPRGFKLLLTYPFDYRTQQPECLDFLGEIKTWCQAQLASLSCTTAHDERIYVEFEDENEAMMFKLAWGSRTSVQLVKQ